MFFLKTVETAEEIVPTRDGRWRIVLRAGAGGPVYDVLWADATRDGCEQFIRARREFQDMQDRFELDRNVVEPGPGGCQLELGGNTVTARSADGKFLGSASFARICWRDAMIIGASRGALTATSITVDENVRGGGIAEAMHDLVAKAYGIPTVPNAVHGLPGSLSQLAQGFWAHRALRRQVPGLSGDSVAQTVERRARFDAPRHEWRQEVTRLPDSVEPEKNFAFVVSVSRMTGWHVMEGLTDQAGGVGWWLAVPDGRSFSADGFYEAGEPVLGRNQQPCKLRFEVSHSLLADMQATWLENCPDVLQEAEDYARRALVRFGILDREALPPEDGHGPEEALRECVPLLASAVLDGILPPKPARERQDDCPLPSEAVPMMA